MTAGKFFGLQVMDTHGHMVLDTFKDNHNSIVLLKITKEVKCPQIDTEGQGGSQCSLTKLNF